MKFIYRLQLVLAVWLIISPWVLRFASVTPALWSAVVSGVLIGLLTLWAMYGFDGPNPPVQSS